MNVQTQKSSFAGPAGMLEVARDEPSGASRGVAVIAHPHPLFGGTLDNKVVQTLARAFTQAGWADLSNARAALTIGKQALEFVGVDDPHLSYDRYTAVAGRNDPAAALTVGVTHAPYRRILDAMTGDGAGLVIAGHTHGGQLCLPFYGTLVTNCDLDRHRAKGVSRWWPGAGDQPSSAAPAGAAWMEVSAGLGTSPYAPVRFACRPEATLLTLTAKPAAG